MQVISVPQGLKAAVAALALSMPLCALQVILMKQAPWWKLPYARIGMTCLPALILFAVLAAMLLRGRMSGFYLALASGVAWFASTASTAVRLHNVSLGFFSVFLGLFLLLFFTWLKSELGKSFFDPKLRWYEGLPRSIPGLSCEIVGYEPREVYRVSRLDRDGAFLFRERAVEGLTGAARRSENELVFSFRDREIQCSGVPIRFLSRSGAKCGVGFQFKKMSPDMQKALGDFVETLKGEGYVS